MFFRREKVKEPSFLDRLEKLKAFRFATEHLSTTQARVIRNGVAAVVEDVPGYGPHVNKAGLLMGNEIGILVNGGYQMFWRSPAGPRIPATATQLKELHAFQEDLKEGLGLTSLYNESLGTISGQHLYDRVEHRDEGPVHKPWEHK